MKLVIVIKNKLYFFLKAARFVITAQLRLADQMEKISIAFLGSERCALITLET